MEKEIYGWFENVTFAVLSSGTPFPGSPSCNLTAFSDALQDLLVGERGAKATQPRPKRVGSFQDVDTANEDDSLPRPRTNSWARSTSRATASVEPKEANIPAARTRSSIRIHEHSRDKVASGSRASPQRSGAYTPGRSRSHRAARTLGKKSVVYQVLIMIVVVIFAYLPVCSAKILFSFGSATDQQS